MAGKNLMRNKEMIKRMETNDNHAKVRLINPAKNKLGRISKFKNLS